jgi:hypothetical protein
MKPSKSSSKQRYDATNNPLPKSEDEFARYFLRWVRNPDTEFYVFVSNTANVQLWKNLVHEEPDSDTVRDFIGKSRTRWMTTFARSWNDMIQKPSTLIPMSRNSTQISSKFVLSTAYPSRLNSGYYSSG